MVELELDEEEFEEEIQEDTIEEEKPASMSWLLQIVLENLGVSSNGCKIQTSPATSVRIESLQVLSAITNHFLLLKMHLMLIGMALNNSFRDPAAEVRLHASRVLDFIGHSINTFLSSQGKEI